MARLKIENVTKKFGDFAALKNASFDAEDGEFLAVLGPSGCGKSTLLRVIAGFEEATSGSVIIGERTVSGEGLHVPPEKRRVGIVFQNYALWPHMTVGENVGYALRVQKTPRAERAKRIADALDLVDLAGFADRKPGLLSGGQRQRVALARCFVAAPSLVLLDEPLANLDVHLRSSMEQEFSKFHKQSGTTMMYITHDQSEAMALADRIAVMDHGEIVQIATPLELFLRPATQMVASFIGHGIVVPASVSAVGKNGKCRADLFGSTIALRCAPGQPSGQTMVCLKSGDLSLTRQRNDAIAGSVRRAIYRGGYQRAEVVPEAAPELVLNVDVPEGTPVESGQAVHIKVDDGWVIPGSGH